MSASIYTCKDCGKDMLCAVWRKYCIKCRKFHDKEDMIEYMSHKYNLFLDSNPHRFDYDRQCRWTCNACRYSFRRTCNEIMARGGCVVCKLMSELENEKEILHKFNESNRKLLINRFPMSYGENVVMVYLNEMGIHFLQEYEFSDFKNHPFDFYLPGLNICIEYDGRQHVEPCARQGGSKGLVRRLRNDKLRDDYCWVNNISLIRLCFLKSEEENVEILEKYLLMISTTKSVMFVGYKVNFTMIEKRK